MFAHMCGGYKKNSAEQNDFLYDFMSRRLHDVFVGATFFAYLTLAPYDIPISFCIYIFTFVFAYIETYLSRSPTHPSSLLLL